MKSKILKGSLLFVAGFLNLGQASAQMYVSPNSYVFADNQYVYVKQDLELNAATSNFYLRNGAQLLQGVAGAGVNRGVGDLSVFQEGSVNNYQYNYWCSPIGGNIAAAGNSPFGITQLKDITGLITSSAPTILPINSYDGTASPFAIAPYWIFKFVSSTLYSQWSQVGSGSTINAGEGFTMKGSSGTNATTVNAVQNNPGDAQRYDFRGKPNDGTINIPVVIAKRTLTGNPYPSAIDLNMFLTGNANCTGIAYFWEHDKAVDTHLIAEYKGGYGAYAGGTSTYTPAVFYAYDVLGNQGAIASSPGNMYPRRFSPVGQGFMVSGAATGNVQMLNTYRTFVKEGGTSQFERTATSNSVD
jgi:hypothetical protein